MHVIPIPRKLVCIHKHWLVACLNLLLGQGMNASMNDSHNLGMRVLSLKIAFLNFYFFSLEVDACIERLGKTFITENSE